jgi:hypothetical protein
MEDENGSTKAPLIEDDAGLDPRAAAELLASTKHRAQRQFDVWPPYLLFIGSALFLFCYGAVWWSVRHQHPYVGPTGGALAILYGSVVAWIVVVVAVISRANYGVRGASKRRRAFRSGYLIVIVGYSAYQGALYHAHASHAIVYGIFPASIVWLFAGTAFVTIGAIREELPPVLLGGALIALGVASAFTGPVIGWLVSGIGLALVLAGFGATRIVMRRA